MHSRQVVIVSNRAPQIVVDDGGRFRVGPAAGGLASALGPIAVAHDLVWVAAGSSEIERRAAAEGVLQPGVHLVEVTEGRYHRYYDDVANSTLWFVHHGMYDRVSGRAFDAEWHRSWDDYRAVNQQFAEVTAGVAGTGALVLVQDYHLALVGAFLRRRRPDLVLGHFSHTPFASAADLEVLPDSAARELLEAMTAYDACGFHSPAWEAAFRSSAERVIGDAPRTFVAPLGPDRPDLARRAATSGATAYLEALEKTVGDRALVVRVDRLDPSKNLIRGFRAFDELLAHEPRWREQVVFLALSVPSRQSSPEYAAYRRAVEQTVAQVNARWRTDTWTPVVWNVGDGVDRSMAALRRYDVLLVNPVRDGLNLVAKEGPLVNERDGVLVLSRQAGAWATMGSGALAVNPFDVFETRLALARALDMSHRERTARSAMARHGAALFDAESWFATHMETFGLARRRDRSGPLVDVGDDLSAERIAHPVSRPRYLKARHR